MWIQHRAGCCFFRPVDRNDVKVLKEKETDENYEELTRKLKEIRKSLTEIAYSTLGDDGSKNILLEFFSLIDIMKTHHQVRKCIVPENDLSLVLEFDTLLQCEKVIMTKVWIHVE